MAIPSGIRTVERGRLAPRSFCRGGLPRARHETDGFNPTDAWCALAPHEVIVLSTV